MDFAQRIEQIELEAQQMCRRITAIHLGQPIELMSPKIPAIHDVLRVYASKTLQKYFRGCLARRRACARRKIYSRRRITEQLGIFYAGYYHGFCDFFEVALAGMDRTTRAETYRVTRLLLSGMAAFHGCRFRVRRAQFERETEHDSAASQSDELW